MRFKNFVWPHNPRVYSIAFERKLATHKIPFGLHYLQSLGQTRRVLKGEGEFVGENAYELFKQLATVFYEETPGVLVHPVWMTTTAWFAGLELRQMPRRGSGGGGERAGTVSHGGPGGYPVGAVQALWGGAEPDH